MRNLKRGSKNVDVKTLQTLLNDKGFNVGKVDGSFGPATDKAVRAYQKANGLTVDGSVGPATWSKLLGTPVTSTGYSTRGQAKIIVAKPERVRLVVSNKKYYQVTSKTVTNGTFFWGNKPNGILVNNGKILWNDASHAWRGYGQGVLSWDGKAFKVSRVKAATELGNVSWAIGGVTMIGGKGYSPTNEGFSGVYSDVLATRPKTVIGTKDGLVYVMTFKSISHGALLTFLRGMGLDFAVSLDGGGSTSMRVNGAVVQEPTDKGRTVNNWVVID